MNIPVKVIKAKKVKTNPVRLAWSLELDVLLISRKYMTTVDKVNFDGQFAWPSTSI